MAKIKLRLHPPSTNTSGATHHHTPSNSSGSASSPARANSASPTAPSVNPLANAASSASGAVQAQPPPPPSIVRPDPESEEADELEDEEAPSVFEPPKPKRKKRPSNTKLHPRRTTPTSPQPAPTTSTTTLMGASLDGAAVSPSNETFDDLPAAKRRKANIRAGAAGPGRGWRKGLKVGQKPKYLHLGSPPDQEEGMMDEEDEDEEGSFVSRAPSPLTIARPVTITAGTPVPALAPPTTIATPPQPLGSNGKTRTATPHHQQNGWSIKRATTTTVPRRIPPIPPSAPIRAAIKLTVGFAPTSGAREPDRRVRPWLLGSRAIATIGGGELRVPTHWSGPDRDYDPHARAAAVLQNARANGSSVRSTNLELPGTIVRTWVPAGVGTSMDQRAQQQPSATQSLQSQGQETPAYPQVSNLTPPTATTTPTNPNAISPAPTNEAGTAKKSHTTKKVKLSVAAPMVAAPASTVGSPAGSSVIGDGEQWRGSSPAYVFASGTAGP